MPELKHRIVSANVDRAHRRTQSLSERRSRLEDLAAFAGPQTCLPFPPAEDEASNFATRGTNSSRNRSKANSRTLPAKF